MKNLLNTIWASKFMFLGTFFIVFSIFYTSLMAIDFLPEKPTVETTDQNQTVPEAAPEEDEVNDVDKESSVSVKENRLPTTKTNLNSPSASDQDAQVEPVVVKVLPTKINIPKLNKTITVLNPNSRLVTELDSALQNGAVRHPDSATLDEEGNVFILGHSSYLPQVFNENYQAFNGIQDLVWGDTIEVSADGFVYQYRVDKVYRAKASTLTVPIAGTGKMLTLATCNSFGSVDDRYIVEAKQISKKTL